jgi:hypothetical protein
MDALPRRVFKRLPEADRLEIPGENADGLDGHGGERDLSIAARLLDHLQGSKGGDPRRGPEARDGEELVLLHTREGEAVS